jgi:hypothetical protein
MNKGDQKMNSKQIGVVCRAVSRAKNSGGRIRCSAFVRETVVSWMSAGEGPRVIEASVGIDISTLMRWSEGAANKFRRIEVTPELQPPLKFTVIIPSGAELSAPSVAQLIEALELFK